MKYLKEYNQFGSESFYEPISYDDYMKFITYNSGWGKPLSYTEYEVSLIKSVLGKEDRFHLKKNGLASKNPKGQLISIFGGDFGSWYEDKSTWEVMITKYLDDWFIVNADNRGKQNRVNGYYKCDTINGVIELLKKVHISS